MVFRHMLQYTTTLHGNLLAVMVVIRSMHEHPIWQFWYSLHARAITHFWFAAVLKKRWFEA